MSFLRESEFDLAIIAGPRLESWPTIGSRVLSQLCSEAGLKVGVFGGEDLKVLGVLPVPSTGGFVMIQDIQGRMHRVSSRAIVKVSPCPQLPQPFVGWNSEALVPLSTAKTLFENSFIEWMPSVAILGSGNSALRFGSKLLEKFSTEGLEVFCVETQNRAAGWEVERRRFEILGGKVLNARPLSLAPRSALQWEFRVQDDLGVRILEVGRVVSAGPFSSLPGYREYPADSNLYELENTASRIEEDQVEGWQRELHYASALALKIIKSLGFDAHKVDPLFRERFERVQKREKLRARQLARYKESRFHFRFDGKWMVHEQWNQLRKFDGVSYQKPNETKLGIFPSIECFEEIGCQKCAEICPENAIDIGSEARAQNKILDPLKCTGCGLCLTTCPSQAIVSVQEGKTSQASLWLVSGLAYEWRVGESVHILNRRGESLGMGRVQEIAESKRIKVEMPAHLVWETRGIRPKAETGAVDRKYLRQSESLKDWPQWMQSRVEVQMNGMRRFLRDQVSAGIALFETGQARAEDTLLCSDQSCGLCAVTMDGVKKFACQSKVHRGMVLQSKESRDVQLPLGVESDSSHEADQRVEICSCLGKTLAEVREQIRSGGESALRTIEGALMKTKLGAGQCHGARCVEVFRDLLANEGFAADKWIDWRFPWRDWTIS